MKPIVALSVMRTFHPMKMVLEHIFWNLQDVLAMNANRDLMSPRTSLNPTPKLIIRKIIRTVIIIIGY